VTVIPALEKLKQDHEFEMSLDYKLNYMARPCLRKNEYINKIEVFI
jgi:hypothetical protein